MLSCYVGAMVNLHLEEAGGWGVFFRCCLEGGVKEGKDEEQKTTIELRDIFLVISHMLLI